MTLRKRHGPVKTHERIINIDGDDIKIIHVGFEISETAWQSFQKIMLKKYDNNVKKKSEAMRLLVNAVNLGIITLEDLEEQIEEKAKHIKDIIYI